MILFDDIYGRRRVIELIALGEFKKTQVQWLVHNEDETCLRKYFYDSNIVYLFNPNATYAQRRIFFDLLMEAEKLIEYS